jgi:hypothetical protein
MLAFNRFRINGQAADHADVGFVDIFADHGDIGFSPAPSDGINAGDLFNLRDNIFVMRRDELAAIVPIGLVAVVFLGVVRSGTDDTALAAEVADREAQLGGRAERLEEKYFYSIGGEYVSGSFCEEAAVIAAVVGDGNADLDARKGSFEVVGEALGRRADGVFIYPVGTHSHDAAKTAGAKLSINSLGLSCCRRLISSLVA